MLRRQSRESRRRQNRGKCGHFKTALTRNHVLPDLLNRKPGQRKPEPVREFTRKRLNLDDEAGGKSGLYARREAAPQGQAYGRERSACAACSRSVEAYPGGR